MPNLFGRSIAIGVTTPKILLIRAVPGYRDGDNLVRSSRDGGIRDSNFIPDYQVPPYKLRLAILKFDFEIVSSLKT